MTDLKPCPFCGGEAKVQDGSAEGLPITVACMNRCVVQPETDAMGSIGNAISAWNKRAPVKCVHDVAKEYSESAEP